MNTSITCSMMILGALQVPTGISTSNSSLSYLIGGIIALLIMGYLVYSLIRPDKF